jgi:hypothetical protein
MTIPLVELPRVLDALRVPLEPDGTGSPEG